MARVLLIIRKFRNRISITEVLVFWFEYLFEMLLKVFNCIAMWNMCLVQRFQ